MRTTKIDSIIIELWRRNTYLDWFLQGTKRNEHFGYINKLKVFVKFKKKRRTDRAKSVALSINSRFLPNSFVFLDAKYLKRNVNVS